MTRDTGNKDAIQHLVQSGRVEREFYTVREFAAACYIAEDTVYRMRVRGEINAVRIGGGPWRIPREEIDRLKDTASGEQVGEKQSA